MFPRNRFAFYIPVALSHWPGAFLEKCGRQKSKGGFHDSCPQAIQLNTDPGTVVKGFLQI